jgi:hypothetical protein
MFLSAAIDSGIGLTAGKKLCGKAVAQSDDTYLTTVNLRKKFSQLKKFLAIGEQPKVETEKLELLESAVSNLQGELTQQKLITETISKENLKTKEELERLRPLVEFMNSFDTPENLKTILTFLKEDYSDISADGKLRPLRVEFSPYVSKKLGEIAKERGITEKEALKELLEDNLKTMDKAEANFKRLEKRSKKRHKGTGM